MGGNLTKCCPDRAVSQLPIPDGGVQSNALGQLILVNDEGVLISVIEDASLEEALLASQLELVGMDLVRQVAAGLEGNKGAVEEDHFWEPD